jgi:ribosomal protein S18 acetylase RimI-like enzyme
MAEIRILRRGDEAVLANVAPEVFDQVIDKHLTTEFLNDARHHLAVAIENGLVVGMASAVHYVHPDKRPQLWINEVGVAPTYRGRGLGKALLSSLFEVGKTLRCTEAWVVTDRPNIPAMRLYSSVGGREPSSEQVMFSFRLTADAPNT